MSYINIGDQRLKLPLIQGGMGVGVSLSSLAGNVAKCGGMGVISSAQIGFREADFATNTKEANKRAIFQEVKKAKEIAEGHGLIGMNIMVALRDYKQHVQAAIAAGVDCIISGAGLPLSLPSLVKNTNVKIAPIVSSSKACEVILKSWHRKYQRVADFIVIEGSLAGGHLGFLLENIQNNSTQKLLDILGEVKAVVRKYEALYHQKVPIFVAGGIYTNDDIKQALTAGADGVQMATRFIATDECDASDAFKQAFINAKKEDLSIVKSPVGMPARALSTPFLKKHQKITKCFSCIQSCHVTNAPYCITQALINAVNGNLDEGIVFSGTNGYRINKIVSVKTLIDELMEGIV